MIIIDALVDIKVTKVFFVSNRALLPKFHIYCDSIILRWSKYRCLSNINRKQCKMWKIFNIFDFYIILKMSILPPLRERVHMFVIGMHL